jgi:hypothetical protein
MHKKAEKEPALQGSMGAATPHRAPIEGRMGPNRATQNRSTAPNNNGGQSQLAIIARRRMDLNVATSGSDRIRRVIAVKSRRSV